MKVVPSVTFNADEFDGSMNLNPVGKIQARVKGFLIKFCARISSV